MSALDEIKKQTQKTQLDAAVIFYDSNAAAAELLKLREDNAKMRQTIALSAKCEEVTLYECTDCNLISTTDGICAECEQPLKSVIYVSL